MLEIVIPLLLVLSVFNLKVYDVDMKKLESLGHFGLKLYDSKSFYGTETLRLSFILEFSFVLFTL